MGIIAKRMTADNINVFTLNKNRYKGDVMRDELSWKRKEVRRFLDTIMNEKLTEDQISIFQVRSMELLEDIKLMEDVGGTRCQN